ncbi:putative Helix-turn-helix domain protein [Vibrio aestuarianus]|nr:putative Helix-turn-helix domain protein [Vibrio aestuarianus]
MHSESANLILMKFAQTLKRWRHQRRFSQLDLANETGISSKHLSFLETGRSSPSKQMVIKLSETLQLPLDAQNQMLTDAGFAVSYTKTDWSDTEMLPVREALEHMLKSHMPYPGLVLDRFWRVVQFNSAAEHLYGLFGIHQGDSLIEHLTTGVLSEAIENWAEVAHFAALRLKAESITQGGVPEFDAAIPKLINDEIILENKVSPVIPTVIKQGDVRISMFSTITQIGTPKDIVLDDIKLELYFPLDKETDEFFKKK